eukprot:TRINITY_DN1020_c2_g1_i1.p1 TRINITY_DN1020_c2_g1~~TRINITY_DN1020_c2_g1_i1.p1  ORF type:complete len:591 (-),score=102.40 TRINITY_DN1020_c2_g1_i1:79-1851(-)
MDSIIHKLRHHVKDALDKHLHDTALFFCNKLVSMSGSPDDHYLLAKTYFDSKQFQRAFSVLVKQNLVQKTPKFCYLAAKCKAELGEWEECLEVLNAINEDEQEQGEKNTSKNDKGEGIPEEGVINMQSVLCLLRAQAYEALENRSRAIEFYTKSLKYDVFCYDAFHTLIGNHMLTSGEEIALVDSLTFTPQSEWLKQLYYSRLSKYTKNNLTDMKLIESCNLLNNIDVISSRAESYYYHNRFHKAYNLTKKLPEDDLFNHMNILTIYLSCLVQLMLKSELFYVAHRLVSIYPSKAVSWYAVGCYYLLIGKCDLARKYFSKSTSCSRVFGPSWLGFGHAFAIEGEHDQALAAYRTAERLLGGSHIPPLCIGVELVRANNIPLANQLILKSSDMCPEDPLVWNELGVVNFKDGKYSEAISNFTWALKLIESSQQDIYENNDSVDEEGGEKEEVGGGGSVSTITTKSSSTTTSRDKVIELHVSEHTVAWEPVFFNLGHCYRKLKDYQNALLFYKKSLELVPNNAGTYCALGFTHHLMGNTDEAIELYHQALGIDPDDSLASDMLRRALNEFAFSSSSSFNPDIPVDDDYDINI